MNLQLLRRFLFTALLLCCGNAYPQEVPPAPFVSLLSLASAPKTFSGMRLAVSGWIALQAEGGKVLHAYLFPSPDHMNASDFPSSVTIDVETLVKASKISYPKVKAAELNRRYVIVYGTFSGNDLTQPRNVGLGEIVEITGIGGLLNLPKK